MVAINDLADIDDQRVAVQARFGPRHLSGHGRADGNDLIVDGTRIRVTAERDPAKLPHAELGVDIALECTGFFTDADKARGASRLRARRRC